MPKRSAAESDTTPTPAPASEQRPAETPRAEHIAPYAQARSIDELPPELRDDPFITAMVSMTPDEEAQERVRWAARDEATARYGEDDVAELAAIAEGTHPSQRGLDAESLERSKQMAADAIARIATMS